MKCMTLKVVLFVLSGWVYAASVIPTILSALSKWMERPSIGE